ncbi:MAG TPA: cyclic nucleotide-binding domain-containing protein [Gaiellaceae bacterium]|nr:cyclic nucleotide-binding domain-containing protein [Gaiellaceae bacterium]
MRMRQDRKRELIKSVPIFSRCSKKELEALGSEFDEIDVPSGRTLTKQGEPGREFVVIVSGTAEVTKDGRRVNMLGAGDFLGEIALLSGGPRTATVTTVSEADLLVLSSRSFARLTKEVPSLQASVVQALSERLATDAL